MKLIYSISWSVLGVAASILIALIIRVLIKKTKYRIEMVFMTPGLNDHQVVDGDELDFTHTVGEKKYAVKAERLYRLKPGFLKGLWCKYKGIKTSFIVVYQHNKTDPVAPVTVAVSARILKKVSESRALDKALKSEFSAPWDLKKILMVIGFLVIAIVVWYLISGDVTF